MAAEPAEEGDSLPALFAPASSPVDPVQTIPAENVSQGIGGLEGALHDEAAPRKAAPINAQGDTLSGAAVGSSGSPSGPGDPANPGALPVEAPLAAQTGAEAPERDFPLQDPAPPVEAAALPPPALEGRPQKEGGSQEEGYPLPEGRIRSRDRGRTARVVEGREGDPARKTANIQAGAKPVFVRVDASSPERTLGNEGRERIITVEFAPETFSAPGGSSSRPSLEALPTAGSPSFQEFFSQEFQENLGQSILQEARFLLNRDGGGTISLALRPETLGTVKIRLELADNRVSGRILVESEEVRQVFERELSSLEQAFRDSGFEGASLEMAMSPDSGGEGRGAWESPQGFSPWGREAAIAEESYESYWFSPRDSQEHLNILA
jgi:hypothetical protein